MNSMDKRILFLIEGKDTENNLTPNIAKKILGLFGEEYEICVYGTCIYELYDKIKDDPYITLLDYLYENKLVDFKGKIAKQAFSQIYLFFDFEPNYQKYSDENIKKCLEFFNDDTTNGKLYISYPMVEAIFYLDNFDSPKRDIKIKSNIFQK